MAKQKVNLLEQHVEKGVFGLTALILVGVIIRFLVLSPNTVSIGDQVAGPGEVYGIVKKKAEAVRAAVQAAKPTQKETPKLAERWAQNAGSPLDRNHLAETLTRAVSWHAPILEVGDVSFGTVGSDKITLVRVSSPSKPVVLAGRNLVVEPPIEPLESRVVRPGVPRVAFNPPPAGVGGVGGVGGVPPPPPPPPAPIQRRRNVIPVGGIVEGVRKDINWATVFFTFNRQEQRERLREAGYSLRLKEILLAWPVIQRRSLRAGTWTEWKDVEGFELYERPAVPPIEMDASGKPIAKTTEAVQAFSAILRGAQPEVMRPEFPPIVSGPRWEIPKLDGIDTKTFSDEGDTRYDEVLKFWDPGFVPVGGGGRGGQWWIENKAQQAREERERRRQEAQQKRLEGKSPEQKARIEANDSLREARRLIDAHDLVAAQQIVEPWTKPGSLIPAPLRDRALTVMDEIEAQLKKEREAEERRQRVAAQRAAVMAKTGLGAALPTGGPPVTILWAHDLTVRPGAIYQYRVRVRLYNTCAARPSLLKEPSDAAKLFLESNWSAPSDPVEIQPDVHFFLTGSARGNAIVRIYKWFMGQWVRYDFPAEIGKKIGGTGKVKVAMLDSPTSRTMAVDFASDYTVVDLDFSRPIATRGGSRRRPKTTTALVYLDARNELRERLYDRDKKSALRKSLEEQVFKQPVTPVDRTAAPPRRPRGPVIPKPR